MTNKKKSAAQIRRMERRAHQRGQTYEYIEPNPPCDGKSVKERDSKETDFGRIEDEQSQEEDKIKYEAALELKTSLDELEKNPLQLNSKDKRSARRKAEALAIQKVKEATGMEDILDVVQLMEWFDTNRERFESESYRKKSQGKEKEKETDKLDRIKLLAVKKYYAVMSDIEQNQDLNAKDRRSAKRKAEAIALQETNIPTMEDLIHWFQENQQKLEQPLKGKKRKIDTEKDEIDHVHSEVTKKNPYILFVGQIPFSTSSDDIFQHFQRHMGKEVITRDCMQIRIPKDEKVKVKKNGNSDRTKGFAFVEFQDPKIMHECLKMHHTSLNGRRINVIRAAGGGKASRAEKQKQRKLEQDEYISSTVDKIINEYIESGKLKEGELDKGSISLCKRRNAATVEAALLQYIEKRGDKTLENPSAFFTKVMCKITDDETHAKFDNKKQNATKSSMR
jgi:RNA recognition motif-containing protein